MDCLNPDVKEGVKTLYPWCLYTGNPYRYEVAIEEALYSG